MLQRFCSALSLLLILSRLAALGTAQGQSQGAQPAAGEHPVFKANARIVVLDVVVSGKNNRPVPGLRQENFRVTEDGKPQTITYFEEHTGTRPPLSDQANQPELPANVFTNIPRVKPGDSVTVLLLDSLNTPLADQSFVRAQTLKYLKTREPDRRIAIFTLGTQLRLVQGFTDDRALLMAAINNPKNGVGAQNSPLLQSHAEVAADQEVSAALAEVHAVDAAAAVQQFMAEQVSTRSGVRLRLTLDALQQLAHYLAAVPGRKNVVWFSGAFPVVIFPDSGLRNPFNAERDDQDEVRQTDALLASSQVAVYPIAADGLATDSIYSAGTDTREAQQPIIKPRVEDARERNANYAAMEQIAKSTGGIAFYNTNGLTDALDRVGEHTANFYTLIYTSTNLATDGRFRKIKVEQINYGGYQLSYRRGYFADRPKTDQAASAKPAIKPVSDPLLPFLRPGLPASTQIPLALRVVRGDAPPGAGPAAQTRNASLGSPAQGGDNAYLKGALSRYRVDFMVPARGLHFDLAADGHRHVSVETALMVYGHDGKPVNWMFRQLNLNLDAAHYATAQASGVNLYMEIDAPNDGVLLRGGVYDLHAGLAGTLEVPLTTLVSPGPVTPSR